MPNKRFVYLGLPIFTAQSIYNFSVNHKPNSVQKAKKYERNQTKPIEGPMPPPVDDEGLGLAPRQGVCLGVFVCVQVSAASLAPSELADEAPLVTASQQRQQLNKQQ